MGKPVEKLVELDDDDLSPINPKENEKDNK